MIDSERLKGEALAGLDHKMDEVILIDPITEVRGQKHGSVAIKINERCCHAEI
jgi:hypothetical protein